MSNGFDFGGNPFGIPDFGRRGRRGSRGGPGRFVIRRARRDRERRDRKKRGGLPAVIIPIPVPTSLPSPFPAGPAANDAVFGRATGQVLGRVVGGVVGAIIVATGVAIAERVAELKKTRAQREKEAEKIGIERQNERLARDRDIRTLPAPDKIAEISEGIFAPRLEIPGAIRTGKLPKPEIFPETIPEIPIKIPEIRPPALPAPIATPEIPVPVVPSPLPGGLPAGRPIPGFGVPGTLPASPSPFTPPGTFPFGRPISFPRISPIGAPRLQPIGDLLPDVPLTPINVPGVGSQPFQFIADQPLPQTQQERKCKEVKRRRRRKSECSEGFFRELPNSTQFTDWRTVNCVTREETERSKLSNQGFDVSNVENI